MKIYSDKLPGTLARGLAKIYLISGDEPLLVTEAADAVRAKARAEGFSEREVLFTGRGFDWQALTAHGANLSLFSDQRLIELRMASAKPGKDGAAALLRYFERPPEDTVLLMIAPKLDRGAAASKWAKAAISAGVFVQVWPVDAQRLPGWIRGRARDAGLELDDSAAALLAERVEGNLLAADQEVKKLRLLNGPGRLDEEGVRQSVADSARFDVFALSDAALAGNASRALRVLDGLRTEGVEPPLVLWAVTRELRSLVGIAWAMDRNQSPSEAMRGVWPRRQPLLAGAVRRLGLNGLHRLMERAALADRVIKGQRAGRPWEALTAVVAGVAGAG